MSAAPHLTLREAVKNQSCNFHDKGGGSIAFSGYCKYNLQGGVYSGLGSGLTTYNFLVGAAGAKK